jgi:DNA helicase-2/ATP-dependent DNA helicase PcrA
VAQVVARVYPAYEKRLRDANALDFDDLLYWPARALKHDEELRAELDARFRFVLIDEYQDTNQAQYALARLLSVDYPNLCVVGDPDQCLPPGTLIATPAGPRPIEMLHDGDTVLSACGWGKVTPMAVEKVMVNPYRGKLITIRCEGGAVLKATPNHIGFARLRADASLHYTYLMWKRGIGYRIGTTRGVRASKDGLIVSGLQVRTNQEVADAIWLLRTSTNSGEARFHEQYFSVKYGIPTMVFFARGRKMDLTQEWIDQLYRDIATEAGAARLMADLCLDRRFPHHRPGAVTRKAWARRHVRFTMFGDGRPFTLKPWHEHRVQLVTSGQEMRDAAQKRFRVRNGQRGTWRIETSRKEYADAYTLAQNICTLADDMEIIPRARLTSAKAFPFMPVSQIHPGMIVPVVEDGRVVERVVESVEWEDYEGPVFDLSIPNTRNYIADGVVVHNSIYGWRGSDIRNILDFERDFPSARVLTLSLNYRSTKAILHAASTLIAHNRHRRPKDLVTDNPTGTPVTVLTYETSTEEAEGIAKRIRAAVERPEEGEPRRSYRDFAVFVRINALTRTLEAAFVQQRVPYQIVKGLAFFDRKENRDVLAYLRLLLNPKDDLSFLRVVNEPPRGIGKVSLEHLRAYAEPREMSLLAAAREVAKVPLLKGKAANAIHNFAVMMDELAQLAEASPEEVIRAVLDRSGYRDMLKNSADVEDQERLANIEELITAARQFAQEDPTRTIGDFLENITLASDVDGWDQAQDCVSIMTLHAAKGLEFPVVYMMAVEQGLLPHERSLAKSDDVEEERRLAFVGMTRAREELYLSFTRTREFRGQSLYAIPSMFLDELPQDRLRNLDLSAGASAVDAAARYRSGGAAAASGWDEAGIPMRPRPIPPQPAPTPSEPYVAGNLVRHEKYGLGRVLDVSGNGVLRMVRVRFQTAGERTFYASKVKLVVVEEHR